MVKVNTQGHPGAFSQEVLKDGCQQNEGPNQKEENMEAGKHGMSHIK